MTKNKDRDAALPLEVRRVQRTVTRWRRTRAKLCKMPDSLWAAAAAAASTHGVARVATAVNLGYTALKQRTNSVAAPQAAEGAFVELRGSDVWAASPGPEATVEVLEADGSRMLLRVPAGHPMDAGAVVAAFRRRQ